MSLEIETVEDGVVIPVKVVPGASRDQVAGPLGSDLKIRVRAAAEAGKANRAVCDLLARHLDISPRNVRVIDGHHHPRKRILARQIDEEQVRRRLGCPDATA